MSAGRLAGKITSIDLGIGTTHAVLTGDDGKTRKFGVFDASISPNDWKVGLRVTFEEGSKAGEAKHVRLLSTDSGFGKKIATVAIDSAKYIQYYYTEDISRDGVEVAYTYRVEKGWRDIQLDEGSSPHVSVHHPKSDVINRTADVPEPVCDGATHSAKAIVGFGAGEDVKIGAEVEITVSLTVQPSQPGGGTLEEATATKTLTLTETSTTRHRPRATTSSDEPSGIDTSIGEWAKTTPSR